MVSRFVDLVPSFVVSFVGECLLVESTHTNVSVVFCRKVLFSALMNPVHLSKNKEDLAPS